MNLYFALEGLFLLFVSFLSGASFDDEIVILEEEFKKHTVQLKIPLKYFFHFVHKSRRKRFSLVGVIHEIVGYLFAITFIITSFFVEKTKVSLGLFGTDFTSTLFFSGYIAFGIIILVLTVPTGFYYEKKRWKFMKTTEAYQKKTKFEKFIAHFSRDQ